MKVWEIGGAFGLENLRLAERPAPVPGPGQVVVSVAASSLNYRDLLMVRGRYNPRQPLPLVPLSDGVGRVVAVGEGVERVAIGDRVAATFAPSWIAGEPTLAELRRVRGGPLDGLLTERILLRDDECVHVPAHLTDVEAATLPCAGVTAWDALCVQGDVGPGDTVLVLGTGGVSLFGLQVARLLGARVVVTSSSDEKLERARALGAFATVNYRDTPAWGKAVRELSDGGVDHVLEVGGAGTLEQSLLAVRPGGTISLVGNLSGGRTEVDLVRVFMGRVRLQGVLVGHRKAFEGLCRAAQAHALRPVIDRVFPFAQAPAAFEHLGRGAHFGKVCIDHAAEG